MAISTIVVGKRLQEARKNMNYTQAYVAEQIDLSVTQLSRIENGNRSITLEKLSVICDLLYISVVDVLYEAETTDYPAYGHMFEETIKDCSAETIADMLNTCKAMAEIEKRSKEK